MTLPNSGSLALSQIQGEFGGSNPIGLNEYYRGGSLVPSHANTSGIPSSGQISVNQFYGKSNAAPIDTTVSGNQGTSSASGKFGQVNKGIQAAADGTDFPAIGSWSDSSFTNSSGNASFTITGFASGASNLAANTPRFSIAGNNVGPSFSALTGYNVLSGGGLNINISSNTGSASANVGTRYTPNAFTGALNGSGGLTANFS